MQKRIVSAAAALIALGLAGAASAAGQSTDITGGAPGSSSTPATPSYALSISGQVAAACSAGAYSDSLNLQNITNADGTLNTGAINGQFKQSASKFWCNGVNSTYSVTVSSLKGPTLPSGATAAGFTNEVTYKVTHNLPTTPALFNDYVKITLTQSAATGLLIAGSYTGSVVVTLTAAS